MKLLLYFQRRVYGERDKKLSLIRKSSEDLTIVDRCRILWTICEETRGQCYLHGRTDLGDKFSHIQDEIYDVIITVEKEIDEIMALTD